MRLSIASARAVALLAAGAMSSVGAPLRAQMTQYSSPGEFREQRENLQATLDRSLQEARWRFGPLFLDPWIELQSVELVDESDFGGENGAGEELTGTVGAGLRGYVPFGAESTFAFHALPAYVWWQDSPERRQVNGRFGAGFFANRGRTGIEVSATVDENLGFLSREVEQRVNQRREEGTLSLEVDVGADVTLFGVANPRRYRYPDEDETDLDLRSRERDENLFTAGARFTLAGNLSLGVGVERSEVEFDSVTNDLSNSGVSPILHLDYDIFPVYLSARLAYRDLEPEGESRFVDYQGPTGEVEIGWHPIGRLELQLTGRRNVVYGVDDRWFYFEDDGIGLGCRTSLSSRSSLRVFVEDSGEDYTGAADSPRRVDDSSSIGGDLTVALGRLTLSIGARRTKYDSNLSEFDRDTNQIRSSLTFGGGGGRGGSPWG